MVKNLIRLCGVNDNFKYSFQSISVFAPVIILYSIAKASIGT